MRLLEIAGIVLKRPRFIGNTVVEKGVLLLTYTEQFRAFRNVVDVGLFLQHYTLILEPSWSGHANRNILCLSRFTGHPIIVMAPEKSDFIFLKRLKNNLIPVSIGSCDWANPLIFRPINKQPKRYDAIMLAGWRQYKRHHTLLRTLRDIGDPSFRVALVARSWTGNRKNIERLIDLYNVASAVDIFEDLAPEKVNEILNQSKVNILLSLQEGGNRSLSEGFFAGVPAIALKRNVGLPKDHFTSHTGELIDERDLGSTLLYFRKHWSRYDPRPWAEANITPEAATTKLNEIIREFALQRGEEWTYDLALKCNSPNLKYYPDETAGKRLPSMEDIILQYARSEEIRNMIHRV